MKKGLLQLAILACGGLAVLSGGSAASAVECPEGTLHAGSEVSSLVECNLDDEGQPDLMDTVIQVINVIVGIIGVLAVAVIVIGAVFFVTSQGDAGKVARARNTILYGIVGLVVALLAFAIVNFVLSAVFGNGGGTTSEGANDGESSSVESESEE